MKLVQLSKHIPTFSVGVLFIFSAILKIVSMAAFEMYLYEFHVASFELVAVATRLIIASELAVGISLLANLKWADYAAGAMLLVFSIFLIVQVMQGNTENCHCMGETFELSPDKSLSKNFLAMLILLFGHRMAKYLKQSKKSWIISVVVISIVSLVSVCAVNPPDFMRLVKDREYSQEHLTRLLQREFPSGLEGDKVVCVLSAKCGACKMAARKMEGIFIRNDWKDDEVITIFSDTKHSTPIELRVDTFFMETKTKRRNVLYVNDDTLSKVAPRVPTVFLLKDGVVKKTFGYRNISSGEFER